MDERWVARKAEKMVATRGIDSVVRLVVLKALMLDALKDVKMAATTVYGTVSKRGYSSVDLRAYQMVVALDLW